MQGGSDPSLEEVGGAQGQSSRGTARRGNVPWGTRGQARSLRVCGRDFICRAFVIPYPRQVGCGKIRKGSRFKKKVLTLESVEFNGGRLFGPRGWVGIKAGARSLRASGVGGGLSRHPGYGYSLLPRYPARRTTGMLTWPRRMVMILITLLVLRIHFTCPDSANTTTP